MNVSTLFLQYLADQDLTQLMKFLNSCVPSGLAPPFNTDESDVFNWKAACDLTLTVYPHESAKTQI